jgi:hypothetical protein
MTAKGITRIALIGAIACALSAPAAAHGRNVNTSTSGKAPEHCSDIKVRFDDREGVRAEESVPLPKSGADGLQIRLPEHTGMWIYGDDSGNSILMVCKAALRPETLKAISVSYADGRILASGPQEDEDWTVHLIVRAPRDTKLDLEAVNGPIGVRDMGGAVTARASNGPLSFRRCSGAIDAQTLNGPLSFSDSSGDVNARAVNGPISLSGEGGRARLEAKNGPISIKLRGDRWDGDIEAHVQNGPLSLSVPENYRTGVRVDISGGGPVSCPDDPCRGARKTWDERSKSIEFGEGSPAVRVSVVNGPVSIKSSGPDRDREY